MLKFLQEKEYNFSDTNLLLSESSNNDLYQPVSLYFQTNQDDKNLLTFKKVYFLHPTINSFTEENVKFKNWLLSLGVKVFDGANFIRQEIIDQDKTLNKVLNVIQINLDFWNFIFKYRKSLLESELKQLANFYIIDTAKTLCTYVCECYLSDYYKEKSEPSTESIFQELGLEGNFLMKDYCLEPKYLSEWRKLFNIIGLKRSENTQIFKDKLVYFIQDGKMSFENHLKITKFCFDIFRNNRNIFEDIDLSQFKVYTTDNYLKSVSSCILSDDYTQDRPLDSILPEYSLPNQIHKIYLEKISDKFQNWKDFFLVLNPKVELNFTEIVKQKISLIASNPDSVTIQNILVIWKTILTFKDELLKTHKEELKKIPLLLKNNTLSVPPDCYFPKEYNPSTDIEELLIGYYDYFISPSFKEISGLSCADLKYFFNKIGVEEEIKRINVAIKMIGKSLKLYYLH